MKSLKPFFARLFMFLGILTLAYSCEKNDEGPSDNEILKNQLVGTWNIPNYRTICFNEQNEFIDTSFARFNDILKVHYILKGNYKIENEQLRLSDTKLLYAIGQDMDNIVGFSTTSQPLNNIEIQNDKLTMEGVTILTTNSNKVTGLQGTWNTESLFSAYVRDSSVTHFGGIRTEVYSFREGSDTIDYNFNYGDSPGLLYIKDGEVGYSYENNILSMDKWLHRSTVSFSEDKMYWTNLNINVFTKRQNN